MKPAKLPTFAESAYIVMDRAAEKMADSDLSKKHP
jgi:hypothetical protein